MGKVFVSSGDVCSTIVLGNVVVTVLVVLFDPDIPRGVGSNSALLGLIGTDWSNKESNSTLDDTFVALAPTGTGALFTCVALGTGATVGAMVGYTA